MHFLAGARNLFSSPKHPRQLLLLSGYLGLFPGRELQSGRGMKPTLHPHALLRMRMLATTPWLPHYDFIVCNLTNTVTVLLSHKLFSSRHLKILNHTTENKFHRLGLFCSFQGKGQGDDVLAAWWEEAVRYQQRQHNRCCNNSQQQGLCQQHTANHLHCDRSCSSLFRVFLNTSSGQQ